MSTIYDVKKNIQWEETPEQEDERARKARIGLRIADRKAKEREADIRKRGFCARCGCLLPLTGRCDNCGCTEKKELHFPPLPKRIETIDHSKGLVKGGYVNPTILKMYDK